MVMRHVMCLELLANLFFSDKPIGVSDGRQTYFKGAVSRNSAKLGNYKIPVKVKRNIKITA